MDVSPEPVQLIDLAEAYCGKGFFLKLFAALQGNSFTSSPEYLELKLSITSFLDRNSTEQHSLDLSYLDTTKDGAELFKEQLPRLNRRAMWVAFIQLLMLTAAAGAAAIYFRVQPDMRLLNFLAIILPALALLEVLAYKYFRQALYTQCMLPRARDVLKTDKRRPVLLIRSFQDDGAQIYRYQNEATTDARGHTTWTRTLVSSRFEEAFTPALDRFGPVIAVGNPSEELPEPGAARAHFTDAVWKQPVLDMIEQSRLIVLVCGLKMKSNDVAEPSLVAAGPLAITDLTPGVRWEVEHILANNHQGKLLVLVKPHAPDDSLAAQFAALRRFWRWEAPPFTAADIVALHFPMSSRPLVLKCKEGLHDEESYDRAIDIAFHEMFCRAKA